MDFEGFDWDAGNRKKIGSRGVSIAEIEDVFRDTLTIFADSLHSIEEQRFKAIGRTVQGRFTLVVFTLRRRVKFELKPKDKSVNLRLPEELLAAVRARAEKVGMP